MEKEPVKLQYLEQGLQSFKLITDWYFGDLVCSNENLANNINSFTEKVVKNPAAFSSKHKHTSQLATGKFASLKDMTGVTGSDGFIIGKNLRLSEEKSYEHCVCLGPKGSGKTVSFFILNLLSLPNVSIVVTDPKGEIFKKCFNKLSTNVKYLF